MATSTKTAPKQPEMQNYVVIADAININTGTKEKPEVTRLHRGSVITASPEHEQIKEFLHMGGVLPEATIEEEARALLKKGNAKSPTIQKIDGQYRLTGAGAAKKMGAADDPVAEPQEESLPLVPTN